MGFWAEVSELNNLAQAKLKEGHGAESIREAQRELAARPTSGEPIGARRSRRKSFFLYVLIGALWQSTRHR